MSKFRSLLAAVSILLCAATLPVNGGLPKRHPAIAGYFLFQQDIPAKAVVLKGQGSTPANPSAGWYKLFVDSTGALKLLDSAGGVTTFGTGGGGFALQTETSFTDNSNAAIWLKAPVGSSTSFLNFFDSSNNQLVNIDQAGVVYAQRFNAAEGNYFSSTNSLYLKTNSGSYGAEIPRTGGIIFLPGFNGGAATAPSALVDSTQMTDGFSALSATNEHSLLWDNASLTHNWSTGAVATQRFFRIRPQTITATGASTFTNAATLSIGGAPTAGTNATITNPYAFWVESGLSRFDGRINAVNADVSNPSVQAQNDTGPALRGISLSSYGGYLTSRSSIALTASQTGTLPGNSTAATVLIKREHVLGGFTSTGPVLQVEQATGTGNLLSLVNSGGTAAAFDQNGVLLIGGASSPGTNTKLQLGTPATTDNAVNIYIEPTSTTTAALAIQSNASQSANLVTYRNSAGTTMGGVLANGQPYWSNGLGGVVGYGGALNTTTTALNVVAIGLQAGEGLTNGGTNILIGSEAGRGLTTGSANVFIGYQAVNWDTAIANSVVIGSEAFDQGAVSYTGTGPVLAIGQKSGADLTTQNNIAVFGSSTSPLNDWYFGESYSTASPSDITFQPSVASGTNIAGSSFYLRSGAGTGNATPGKLYLQYASAGSSGATVQSYTTAVTIDSTATDVTGLLQVDRIAGTTSAPSISAGAAAGTTPTVSVTGTDLAGEIVITTGTGSVGSGTLATITLNTAFANDCYPVIQAADADSRGVAVSITHSSTGFTIVAGAAGWATSTEYRWTYIVAGR